MTTHTFSRTSLSHKRKPWLQNLKHLQLGSVGYLFLLYISGLIHHMGTVWEIDPVEGLTAVELIGVEMDI